MSKEIKPFGFYRLEANGPVLRVVYYNGSRRYPYLGFWENGASDWYALNDAEYLGPELPPQGEWVDIDLTKVTLADLPIKARFRDDEVNRWTDRDKQLTGFNSSNEEPPFHCNVNMEWNYCQVWRPL